MKRSRRVWVQVHLWLGLTLGVIGALLGLSGCILVYDHEVDAWLHPGRYAISGADVALTATNYVNSAEAQSTGSARVTALRFPDREGRPVIAFARSPGNGPFQRVYLDPPTGRVLDRSSAVELVPWLHTFHESLNLRDYKGREIVGVVGIAMLISALSGLYLWWPSRAVAFRRGVGTLRNLHYTIGFWAFAMLAVLSLTGIVLSYPDAARTVVGASPSPRNIQAVASERATMNVDDAVAIARGRYPDATVVGVGMPAGPRGVYRINLREAGDTRARAGTAVFVDPRSGEILSRIDRSTGSGGDAILLWVRMIHEGSALGGIYALLVFLGGLVPPLMVVTGLTMWLRKRRPNPRIPAAAMAD